MHKILVTGVAGFIGFHVITRLLKEKKNQVIGLDSINEYYDVVLKRGRLNHTGIETKNISYGKKINSSIYDNYSFIQLKLEDKEQLDLLFKEEQFTHVIHLAAQAGVRYSITNPYSYIDSNITGFMNILEACRQYPVKHLVYASSSSVYGLNKEQPFSVQQDVSHPVSLYAATKKSNELIAHSYSYLYKIPLTGLRFFTVYGPWGRPDMAYFLFTKAIIENTPIEVYNYGKMERDFTYIDDIVEAIEKIYKNPPIENNLWEENDKSTSIAPYKIYNLGNNAPVNLLEFIKIIEERVGKESKKIFLPIQPGDVYSTFADVSGIERDFSYKPYTDLTIGIDNFVTWYYEFYNL